MSDPDRLDWTVTLTGDALAVGCLGYAYFTGSTTAVYLGLGAAAVVFGYNHPIR